jgi:hypothetical protein
MKGLLITALLLITATPAAAQIDIKVTPQDRERLEIITPAPYLEITRPRENDWYPEGVRVPFEPAFVAPFAAEYETPTTRGQFGFAGWTAQSIPVGPSGQMHNEPPGWLMFGFAFTWGASPRPPLRPAAGTPAPAR